MADKNKKTVLVVEDDPSLLQILTSRLKRSGIEVLQARDGEEALSLAEANQPDLILLDLILPGKLDGFEVLEKMQASPNLQNRPVVIISNLGQESDIRRVKQFGVLEYFIKAKTSIDDLVEKIKAVLAK